jgi:formylglycine-generating enzyme required for sulfatase activity
MPNELGFYDMSGNFSEWASTLIAYQEWINGWGELRYAYPYCGGRYTSSEKECEVTEYNLVKTNSLYDVGLRLALSIN